MWWSMEHPKQEKYMYPSMILEALNKLCDFVARMPLIKHMRQLVDVD